MIIKSQWLLHYSLFMSYLPDWEPASRVKQELFPCEHQRDGKRLTGGNWECWHHWAWPAVSGTIYSTTTGLVVYVIVIGPDGMAKWIERLYLPFWVVQAGLTRQDGRMNQASVSPFGDRVIWTSSVLTVVGSNQWLKNVYLSLPNQAFGIIRTGQGLVGLMSG